MKAVVYKGTRDVQVEEVENPRIEQPTDMIVKVSSAAICGSDLHMYEGRTAAEPGTALGHEIMGTVDEVGDAVQQVKKGDRVVLPFNIGCGACFNCVRGYTNACYYYGPEGSAGAGYGYVGLGPYAGGQAEYVRVPMADFNAVKLPGKAGDEREDDFLMLADIFPTAYHAAVLANVQLGYDVAIFGAGPVGLLSVMAAKLRGAGEIHIVDHQKDRLAKAEELGAIPIDMATGDPVEQIQRHKAKSNVNEALRPGEELRAQSVLCGIDAVGYQSHDASDFDREHHTQAIDHLIKLLAPTGALGLIGVYMPDDPGEDGPAAEGKYLLPLGELWNKGIMVGMGQAPVKQYSEQLRDLVIAGKADPGRIVSHHIAIDQAPEMYEQFDRREAGVMKVVIQF